MAVIGNIHFFLQKNSSSCSGSGISWAL